MVEGIVIDEQSIRYLYRFLRHGALSSRVHCQDPHVKGPAGALKSTLVQGEDAVVAFAKEWDGKGQIYISRNPMVAWNQPAKHTCLSFDIDPIYDKSKGATDEEVQKAVQAGQKVLQKYPGGLLATSGNGVLLLYSMPQDITVSLNGTLQPAYKALTEEIAAQIQKEVPCNVDILADDARLIRLVGTKNVKGSPERHRMSKFLFVPQGQAYCVPLLTRLKELAVSPRPKAEVSKEAWEPWITKAMAGVSEGQRHPTLIRLAGYFFGKRLPFDIVMTLLSEFNSNCTPPKTEDELLTAVQDVHNRIKRGDWDAEEQARQAEQSTIEVITFKENSDEYLKQLQQRSSIKTPEIAWPFKSLNEMLWDVPRGHIVTIGSWTGRGKTSIMMTTAEHITRNGKSVLYWSTEMSEKEIKDCYISVATGIRRLHMHNGQLTEQEWATFHGFYPKFMERPFHMNAMRRPSLKELRRVLETFKPDVLMVDYLQRIASTGGGDRRREIAEFTMGLKDEVDKHNVACIVASQFKRPQKTQQGFLVPPTMFDFAECGDIEHVTSVPMILHPVPNQKGVIPDIINPNREETVVCNVPKNRYSGQTGTIYFTVDKLTSLFREA
jgi:replicative DNA helicase